MKSDPSVAVAADVAFVRGGSPLTHELFEFSRNSQIIDFQRRAIANADGASCINVSLQ